MLYIHLKLTTQKFLLLLFESYNILLIIILFQKNYKKLNFKKMEANSGINSINISTGIIRHKLIFIGDAGVGKTTIINIIQGNKFQEEYDATIGVDFYPKTIRFREIEIKLQIWDTAGQERYKGLIPSYVRNSSIIFLVYDVSNKNSFDNMPGWIEFIKKLENLDKTILVLVANKIDLKERIINQEQGKQLSQKENMLLYEVSAKDNNIIMNMFYNVIAQLPEIKEKCDNDDYISLVKELKNDNENRNEKIKSKENMESKTTINNKDKNKDENCKKGINSECVLEPYISSSWEIENGNPISGESQRSRLCHC